MTDRVIFLTHADVVVDPAVPVPQWPLSERGRARHAGFCDEARAEVTSIYCSREVKALQAAEITGAALDLTPHPIAELGENDRSATGYLPKPEFEATADRFFANPDISIDGWERACDAQTRIVGAVQQVVAQAPEGTCLIIGHGGTAALLRCHLKAISITRAEDQPPAGGGCWYAFGPDLASSPTDWSVI